MCTRKTLVNNSPGNLCLGTGILSELYKNDVEAFSNLTPLAHQHPVPISLGARLKSKSQTQPLLPEMSSPPPSSIPLRLHHISATGIKHPAMSLSSILPKKSRAPLLGPWRRELMPMLCHALLSATISKFLIINKIRREEWLT